MDERENQPPPAARSNKAVFDVVSQLGRKREYRIKNRISDSLQHTHKKEPVGASQPCLREMELRSSLKKEEAYMTCMYGVSTARFSCVCAGISCPSPRRNGASPAGGFLLLEAAGDATDAGPPAHETRRQKRCSDTAHMHVHGQQQQIYVCIYIYIIYMPWKRWGYFGGNPANRQMSSSVVIKCHIIGRLVRGVRKACIWRIGKAT